MKSKFTPLLLLLLFVSFRLAAQIDSSLLRRIPKDTVTRLLNMDAVYNRPFLQYSKLPVSLGGYVETNWQHIGTDGVSDGHQFQFRRLSIFLASSIAKRIKFLSELEFEDGGKEVSIEYAAVDVELHPLLNLRGGIIVNPIGAFNQNHDGPKWEFTDRPVSAEQMLPDTWSNAGFGIYGKYYQQDWMFGYELYLTGGFDNTIIENEQNKTYLPAAKNNPDRFEESASGEPLITAKIAVRNKKIGEIGLSYMGGVYNKWQNDGIVVDKKRSCNIFAVDFNTSIPVSKTTITGEWAWIFVDVSKTYSQQFGNRQYGGFMDIVQPLIKKKMLGWNDAVINLAFRLEYVDWNAGKFAQTGGNIYDDLWSIMPAMSFRPVPQTVLRLNYRHQKQRDILGNPPATTGGFIVGLSTYF